MFAIFTSRVRSRKDSSPLQFPASPIHYARARKTWQTFGQPETAPAGSRHLRDKEMQMKTTKTDGSRAAQGCPTCRGTHDTRDEVCVDPVDRGFVTALVAIAEAWAAEAAAERTVVLLSLIHI